MGRKLHNILAWFCVAGAVAAGVVWMRSLRFTDSQVGESLSFTHSDPLWWVISHRGTVTLCRQYSRDWGKEFGKVDALGFKFGGLHGPNGSLWNLRVPYWFIVIALLAFPAGRLIVVARKRRSVRGSGFPVNAAAPG